MTDLAPLPDRLNAWTRTEGGAAFCAAVRRRIANRGALDRNMPMKLTASQRGDLAALLGLGSLTPDGVHLGRANRSLLDSAYQIELRQMLIRHGGPLRTKRGEARYRLIRKKLDIEQARSALHQLIVSVPELSSELALLASMTDGSSWLPPTGSRTATRNWGTYCAALAAAAEWYPAQRRSWKFAERELAVRALGGSKKWTSASKKAFSRLVGMPFDDAVFTADTGIRMLGPLSWELERLIADADAARPFIDLPGRAAATQGTINVSAEGVLLIENQETFQALHRTPVPDTWICIWMEGYGSDPLAQFLRCLPDIPFAAWGDLDPHGIEIICNLAARSGRAIHPVAMDEQVYAVGYMLDENTDARTAAQAHALRLTTSAPEVFQPLARAIAVNGGSRCEQEGLHELILPSLPQRLAALGSVTPVPGGLPAEWS